MSDCLESRILKFKLNSVHLKKLLILLIKRVFRLLDDSDECRFVKVIKRDYYGKSADELRNDSVFYNVVRDYVLVNALCNLFLFRCLFG